MLTIHDIYDRLRNAERRAGSQRHLAAQFGVSPQYLSDVINGRAMPGQAILTGLGVRKILAFCEIGEKA